MADQALDHARRHGARAAGARRPRLRASAPMTSWPMNRTRPSRLGARLRLGHVVEQRGELEGACAPVEPVAQVLGQVRHRGPAQGAQRGAGRQRPRRLPPPPERVLPHVEAMRLGLGGRAHRARSPAGAPPSTPRSSRRRSPARPAVRSRAATQLVAHPLRRHAGQRRARRRARRARRRRRARHPGRSGEPHRAQDAHGIVGESAGPAEPDAPRGEVGQPTGGVLTGAAPVAASARSGTASALTVKSRAAEVSAEVGARKSAMSICTAARPPADAARVVEDHEARAQAIGEPARPQPSAPAGTARSSSPASRPPRSASRTAPPTSQAGASAGLGPSERSAADVAHAPRRTPVERELTARRRLRSPRAHHPAARPARRRLVHADDDTAADASAAADGHRPPPRGTREQPGDSAERRGVPRRRAEYRGR